MSSLRSGHHKLASSCKQGLNKKHAEAYSVASAWICRAIRNPDQSDIQVCAMQAMTSAAGLPSMLDREELISQTMRLRSQHAELQQRAELQRQVNSCHCCIPMAGSKQNGW